MPTHARVGLEAPDAVIGLVTMSMNCMTGTWRKPDSQSFVQECYELPLEDVNARQMLQEARDLLRRADRSAPPPPADRMSTKLVISALPFLDDESLAIVGQAQASIECEEQAEVAGGEQIVAPCDAETQRDAAQQQSARRCCGAQVQCKQSTDYAHCERPAAAAAA